MKLIAASLLLVAILVPSVQAASGSAVLEFQGWTVFSMKADAQYDGENASQTRNQIDQAGNKDGTVTQDEVDSAQSMFLAFMGQAGSKMTPGGNGFTLDGNGPTKFEVKELVFRDATGPVTSTAAINVHFLMNMNFPAPSSSAEHTLKVAAGDNNNDQSSNFDIGSVKLRAPSGYIISSAQGLPQGASVSSDKKEIQMSGSFQPQGDNMTIVFSKGGGGSPGLTALAPVGVLAAAALFLRRRPHD